MHEYHLTFWGQVRNAGERWIERDLGIHETDFWFSTAADRAKSKAKLQSCAEAHNCIIAFAVQGHLRHQADQHFVLNDKDHAHHHSFSNSSSPRHRGKRRPAEMFPLSATLFHRISMC